MNAPGSKTLTNQEMVLLAVYLLGGETLPIDTEDIAVKANELAPGAFTWRKYAEQINMEIVRVILSNLKRADNGNLLVGKGNDGWMLTERGLRFAKSFSANSSRAAGSKSPLSQKEKKWRRSEKARMLATAAFEKVSSGQANMVTEQEAETFFRLDSYVTGKTREQKLLRTKNIFGDDRELGEAIRKLGNKVRRN